MKSVYSVQHAIDLANLAHWAQKDLGGAPYILHPLRVMAKMPADREDLQVIAVLHDVLEDTSVTRAQLEEYGYPAPVLDAIATLTRRPLEEYEAFIERVMKNELARAVKLADLEDNLDTSRLGRELTAGDHRRLVKYRQAWARLKPTPQRG